MGLPVVAIVGRPNVGKSSLFNALAGRRQSIVEPTPGVTRDRVSSVIEVDGVFLELVDTGGYGIEDVDDLTEHVERQIRFAIDSASLILFVTDLRDGVVPLDKTVATLLRRHTERVLMLVNKTDEPKLAPQAAEFARLGFGEPLCVSAVHGIGKTELRRVIVERLASSTEPAPAEPVMKIALVGKRNTGKSTFINSLAGTDRVIVSEVPGTTRDAIDVRFEKDGRVLMAIDTAGVKKKSKLADSIEFYAFWRAQQSIDRADVVLLLLDATAETTHVDKSLAQYVLEQFKPVVIVVNKWDLAKGRASTDAYGEYLSKTLPGLGFAPIAFVSALDDRNVLSAVDVAGNLFNQAQMRIGTGALNQAVTSATEGAHPPMRRGQQRPKIYYSTQVAVCPPTVVLFVNSVKAFREDYLRFLLNRLRDVVPFAEVPIRLVLRTHRRESASATNRGRTG